MRERGSVTVLTLLVVGVVAMVTILMVGTTAAAVTRGRVEAAADLTALAAAVGGHDAAVSLARLNFVRIVEFTARGALVTVTVSGDSATATASAELVAGYQQAPPEGSGP